MGDDASSLPRFDEWRRDVAGSVGMWDYATQKGGITLAIAFGSLFWPRLIEVEDCVLLVERYDPDVFQQWRDRLGNEREAIERVINHVHLWDLFDPDSEGVPARELDSLAAVLGRTWRAALDAQFPDRIGEVHVAREGEDYGPTLTLFTSHRSTGST